MIYYGEVFGFLLAWLLVYVVGAQQPTTSSEPTAIDRVAISESGTMISETETTLPRR